MAQKPPAKKKPALAEAPMPEAMPTPVAEPTPERTRGTRKPRSMASTASLKARGFARQNPRLGSAAKIAGRGLIPGLGWLGLMAYLMSDGGMEEESHDFQADNMASAMEMVGMGDGGYGAEEDEWREGLSAAAAPYQYGMGRPANQVPLNPSISPELEALLGADRGRLAGLVPNLPMGSAAAYAAEGLY